MTDRDRFPGDRSRTRRHEESDEVRDLLRARLDATSYLDSGRGSGDDRRRADSVHRETRPCDAVGEILGGDDQGGVADRTGDAAGEKGVLTAHADDPSVAGPGHDRQSCVGHPKE